MEFIKNSSIPFLEYPRPQFKRDSYFNLNGKWDYAITKSATKPNDFDGVITVPYSPEAKSSGVEKQVFADDFLHYKRVFTLPDNFNKGRVFLNVGACDQITIVYLNGKEVCRHEGGYNSFSAEITSALKEGENELYFLVTDDASSDVYGRGKQTYDRGGIWYTATSGIWQTVWIESTPLDYISSVRLTPKFNEKTLYIAHNCVGEGVFTACIKDGDVVLAKGVANGGELKLDASNCDAWSPESPKLYTVEMTFGDDVVEGYFGMREFSAKVVNGKKLFTLNGKPYFHNGLLDQGYWLDGLYTPPSNEDMYNELKFVKDAGFNMLRKHIKVEPMLWYYYCDVLGILVWQDMLNGGGKYPKLRIMTAPFVNLHLDDTNYKKMKRSEASRRQYMLEAKEMMSNLYNCVSLCLWTPFNECWGQFDAVKVCEELKKLDGTRHYDHASGWQDKGGGDVYSRHIYFRKAKMKNDGKRVLALTEFGGYSFALKGHVFTAKKFGYKGFKSQTALTMAYEKLYRTEIIPAILNDGLCATVYTQLTDVEDEINGLFTYDRVLKIPFEALSEINKEIYTAFEKVTKE